MNPVPLDPAFRDHSFVHLRLRRPMLGIPTTLLLPLLLFQATDGRGPDPAAGILSGIVHDEKGTPVEGARVLARISFDRICTYDFWRGARAPVSREWTGRTDARGRFEIRVPRGYEFRVRAAKEGVSSAEVSVYADRPFLLVLGNPETKPSSPRSAPLSGSFAIQVMAGGKALEGVGIRVPWKFEDLARTDRDGRARLELTKEEAEGPLFVFHPGYRIGVVPRKTFLPGKDRNYLVTLSPGVGIEGRILDASGKPVSGLLILCDSDVPVSDSEVFGSEPWTTRTDDEGRFRFLELAPKWKYWVRTVLPDGAPVELGLGIVKEKTVDLGEFRIGPRHAIFGRVRWKNGEDMKDGRVHILRLYRSPPVQLLVARETPSWPIDHRGRFRIPSIAPGRYELCFEAPGAEPLVRVVQTGRSAEIRLDVRMGEGRKLRGKVLGPDGKVVGGALLRAMPWAGEYLPIVPSGDLGHRGRFLFGNVRVLSRPDGTFLLEHVRTGIPIRLVAIKEDVGKAELRIEPGDPGEVEIRLK